MWKLEKSNVRICQKYDSQPNGIWTWIVFMNIYFYTVKHVTASHLRLFKCELIKFKKLNFKMLHPQQHEPYSKHSAIMYG